MGTLVDGCASFGRRGLYGRTVSFAETAVFAYKANVLAEAVMAEGYSTIINLLANPANQQVRVRLEDGRRPLRRSGLVSQKDLQ